MFDLIEQDLKTARAPQAPPDPNLPELVIYTMPEKFRAVVRQTSALPFLFIGIGAFLLAATGIIIYFVVTQQQKPLPQVPAVVQEADEKSDQKKEEEQRSQDKSEETESLLEEEKETDETEEKTDEKDESEAPKQEQTSGDTPAAPNDDQSQEQRTVPTAPDADEDELSSEEERLYTTAADKPDTDEDGFADGFEIRGLFDPTRGAGARLENSGLVIRYTNPEYRYSFLYPSKWIANATNTSAREVLVSTSTKELFSFRIEENPSGLPAADFYSKIMAPGTDTSQLQSVETETWTGVMSGNGRVVVAVKKAQDAPGAQPAALIIEYKLNTETEVNFVTTFQMMIASLSFTDVTFGKKE